jgi:hypothetical protein
MTKKHGHQLHLHGLSGVIYYRPELDVFWGTFNATAKQGNRNDIQNGGRKEAQKGRHRLQLSPLRYDIVKSSRCASTFRRKLLLPSAEYK